MNELLRQLPKMDLLLEQGRVLHWIERKGRTRVVNALRQVLDDLRRQILEGTDPGDLLVAVVHKLNLMMVADERMRFRRVINGTGVVLHTNMGRAVLSEAATEAAVLAATGYSNLELDLESGERGSRYSHVEELLRDLTGCEDALVVNNNAAAVLLALDTLAKGGETVVSRGELVEIGGSFRVPEVMKLGGTTLVEVGTTNKTHLRDYEQAITEETRAILKVHTSNYRIVGFTKEVSREELVELGRQKEIPVIEDLGSGFLVDLGEFNITDEPRVDQVASAGVDVITFSGDKLLGGPQCGIIVGSKRAVGAMKKNQLTRALRIDKLSIAALEATLRAYLNPERVLEENPTLRMLRLPVDELESRARELARQLQIRLPGATVSAAQDVSRAGGGSLPLVELPTWVVRIQAPGFNEELWAAHLRRQTPALVGRRKQNTLILDVRTVDPEQWGLVGDLLSDAWKALEE